MSRIHPRTRFSMLRFAGYKASIAIAFTVAALTACDNSTGPAPQAPSDVAVIATGATGARVTFSGRSGERYTIQRSAGAASTDFAAVATVDGPTSGTTVTYDDGGLLASTTYRYRVAGAGTSNWSAIKDVTTAAPGSGGTEIVEGDITANRTLTADKTYIVKGFVHVTQGSTLTIQPGTTIMGDFATQGSSLFVLRGAKIQAVGTADLPIVFTSSQPVGQRAPGDWGGLIIVGNGVINRGGEVEVEGTGTSTGTAAGTNYRVLYSGGSDNNDDSGELRYVRVEYAGFAPSANQELNSFTFAGVGKGTKLSYLQALAGLDDSFEWFGGAVDADHLVSYESGDDHFDMSEGYSGRIQFAIAFQSTVLSPTRPSAGGASTDPQGIENDGCNAPASATPCPSGFNATPLTIPLIANFTLVGTGNTASSGPSGGIGIMLRRGTGGYYMNGLVARWPRAGVAVRDAETYARAGNAATPDLNTTDLAIRDVLFVETPNVFETGTNPPRFSFDLAGNNLTNNATATTGGLFTAFPASTSATTTATAFDWTPSTGSAAATGGSGAFSGKVAMTAQGATNTGLTIAGTTYVGAAQPAGPKWWAVWTRYAQQ
jgi:hypothetical protein